MNLFLKILKKEVFFFAFLSPENLTPSYATVSGDEKKCECFIPSLNNQHIKRYAT